MLDNTHVFYRRLAIMMSVIVVFLIGSQAVLTSVTGVYPLHHDPLVAGFLYLSGFLAVPGLLLLGTKYPAAKLPAMVWAHAFLAALLLWYGEPFSPFTPLWSMPILFASIYYGWKGFAGSSITLVVVTILFCTLFANDLPHEYVVYVSLSAIVVALTILTSFLFVLIIMNSHKKNLAIITSRKSEQLQMNRQATLLNSISDAVLTLNRYGRITSQNAAAQAFFDTNQSLLGRDIQTLLDPRDHDDAPVNVHELVGSVKSTLLRDDLSTGHNDTLRHISLQMSRIRSTFDDDEEYGVVVIIRDITTQKTLEEEKDEFISVTSHELRTPVAIAEGSLSNLMVMYEKNADHDQLQMATKTAYDQVIYLSRIINDLSTLSRAERGVGDKIEEIDVVAMLHDLHTRYTDEAQAKSLRLDLDVDAKLPHIETSRLYLEEMLQNFITNAIKYTKEGSVTISAKLLPSGRISCAVKDTGIGISKAEHEKIFEKFYRSEDYRTRETSGTGLGLYVVKKLADKLETKVEIESRLNHGSTFSFTLPIKSHQAASPVVK